MQKLSLDGCARTEYALADPTLVWSWISVGVGIALIGAIITGMELGEIVTGAVLYSVTNHDFSCTDQTAGIVSIEESANATLPDA